MEIGNRRSCLREKVTQNCNRFLPPARDFRRISSMSTPYLLRIFSVVFPFGGTLVWSGYGADIELIGRKPLRSAVPAKRFFYVSCNEILFFGYFCRV